MGPIKKNGVTYAEPQRKMTWKENVQKLGKTLHTFDLRVVRPIELVCAVCLEMQKLSMECISVLKWPENTYHDAIGRSVCVIEFGMV